MSAHILEQIDGGIATLTMDRPHARNAMVDEMVESLSGALQRCARDESVRCVVLTGAGVAFCAGYDITSLIENQEPGSAPVVEKRIQRVLGHVGNIVRLLHEMPKPTLAVIPGPAAGAGFVFALACDMRLASDTAKFTTAFGRIGASGDCGGSYFLTAIAGAARARELYFSSEVFDAHKALEWGIVNLVVPAKLLSLEAGKLSTELANGPTIAFGYMKKNLNAAHSASLQEILELEGAHMIRTLMTEDHKNAAKAFMSKRAPIFSGRK